MDAQRMKETYEYTPEEFARRLERSIQDELRMDLEAFVKKHSIPGNGELLSFTETYLVRAARLAGLLKPYS